MLSAKTIYYTFTFSAMLITAGAIAFGDTAPLRRPADATFTRAHAARATAFTSNDHAPRAAWGRPAALVGPRERASLRHAPLPAADAHRECA